MPVIMHAGGGYRDDRGGGSGGGFREERGGDRGALSAALCYRVLMLVLCHDVITTGSAAKVSSSAARHGCWLY